MAGFPDAEAAGVDLTVELTAADLLGPEAASLFEVGEIPLDVPVVSLGESVHGARYRVVCISCRQDVTISHGAQAPHIDLTAYRCLRCRS